MKFPTFIVCRDRVTDLTNLVAWLERIGLDELYLIDNDSTYPPLLDYYATTAHTVIRTGGNHGHRVGWKLGIILQHTKGTRRFIYTDPDLAPADDCPDDVVERMNEVLNRDSRAIKCGVSLKTDDLADWCRDGMQAWESRFWTDWSERVGAWRAAVDTTLALHNARACRQFRYKPAYRLPAPYLMRHTPWYCDPDNLSDEDEYYRQHADPTVSNWARYVRERAT